MTGCNPFIYCMIPWDTQTVCSMTVLSAYILTFLLFIHHVCMHTHTHIHKHLRNLCYVTGRAVDKLKADVQEKGDLGIVAEVNVVTQIFIETVLLKPTVCSLLGLTCQHNVIFSLLAVLLTFCVSVGLTGQLFESFYLPVSIFAYLPAWLPACVFVFLSVCLSVSFWGGEGSMSLEGENTLF